MATIWTLEVKSVGKFSNEVPPIVLRICSVDMLEDVDFIFCRGSCF